MSEWAPLRAWVSVGTPCGWAVGCPPWVIVRLLPWAERHHPPGAWFHVRRAGRAPGPPCGIGRGSGVDASLHGGPCFSTSPFLLWGRPFAGSWSQAPSPHLVGTQGPHPVWVWPPDPCPQALLMAPARSQGTAFVRLVCCWSLLSGELSCASGSVSAELELVFLEPGLCAGPSPVGRGAALSDGALCSAARLRASPEGAPVLSSSGPPLLSPVPWVPPQLSRCALLPRWAPVRGLPVASLWERVSECCYQRLSMLDQLITVPRPLVLHHSREEPVRTGVFAWFLGSLGPRAGLALETKNRLFAVVPLPPRPPCQCQWWGRQGAEGRAGVSAWAPGRKAGAHPCGHRAEVPGRRFPGLR